MNSNNSLSIGIPTYEGGMSLVRTLNSLYSQNGFDRISEVIVMVDGKELKERIINKIRHPKLKIMYSPVRQGQAARINDIFKYTKTDYLFLTNDDVVIDDKFCTNAFSVISSKADLYCCAVTPLRPRTIVESTLRFRDEIVTRISGSFQNGQNFLRCNGRGIVVSRNFYNLITIPNSLWNNDAYMYIAAQKNKMTIEYAPRLIVKYRLPRTLNEYFRQHAKFAYSSQEIEKYVKKSVARYYVIPQRIVMRVYLEYFLRHPIAMIGYSCLYAIATLRKSAYRPLSIGYWQTDKSTKEI